MGRPKKITKTTQPRKPTKRDTTIRGEKVNFESHPGLFICACCGKKYPKFETYFPKVQSELWAGRDFYLPVCKSCLARLFIHYKEVYGDESRAVRRLCMMFDIYFNQGILDACKDAGKNRSKIHVYISRSNLVQYKGVNGYKTFDSTLDEEYEEEMQRIALYGDENSLDDVPNSIIERWGAGIYDKQEYMILEDHYKMLHRNNPNLDSNQEIFVKSLCNLNLMMVQAMKTRDYDAYTKINEQYSKTFSKAGLKTVEEKDGSNNDTFGVTLAMIAQTTPEEFYMDKELWKDYDNIGEYFDRFVKRPMANLMTGTDVRDTEYFVPEEDDGDE